MFDGAIDFAKRNPYLSVCTGGLAILGHMGCRALENMGLIKKVDHVVNSVFSSNYQIALQRIQEAESNHSPNLDLSGLSLKTIPPELAKLEKLTSLNLKNNDLVELPEALDFLNALSTLYLENNPRLDLKKLDHFRNNHYFIEIDVYDKSLIQKTIFLGDSSSSPISL